MNTRSIFSLTCLLAAAASTYFATGAWATELSRDHRPHRACLERLDTVARREQLPLKAAPTWQAPHASVGQHHYYINTEVRGLDRAYYRVECEANRVGKVTYFALEPGRWVYETPDTLGFAMH